MRLIGQAVCLCLITGSSAVANEAPVAPWYTWARWGLEVGPTGAQAGSDPRDSGYAAQFNGGKIVEALHQVGGQYLVIWGRDGEWAYYNSTLMPKAPGLGERDVLQEAVDAARPLGLPLIVYTVVQSGGHALREHPEWRMVASDGTPINGRVCFNSPYREFMFGLLDEMLAYDIDGFHVDMLDQGFGPPYGCWCTHCQARYEKRYGHPMPPGITWDEAWDKMLEFRADTSATFEDEMYAHIKARKPGLTVDFNYHGNPPFSFEVAQRPIQHAHRGDFITGECGVWGFGALSPSFMSTFYRGTSPERPYQVVLQRGVRMYHDQTTRPLADLRWETMSLLAHGAQVTIVDKTPYSGVIDPIAYGRISAVFAEAAAKREEFGHPVYEEAGLFFSVRTRDWFAREDKEKYFQPFSGAHKALVYEHIPVGMCFDENLSLERLRDFDVVILPNAAILQDRELALLDTYVREGGRLIVTGLSGLYDAHGTTRSSSALQPLIGARAERRMDANDNWFALGNLPPEAQALATDIDTSWPFLAYGPAVVYTPETAVPLGQLHAPIRTSRQLDGKEGTSFPASFGEVVGPAALLHTAGKGIVLTLAVDPGAATASEYRTAEARLLLRNAVRLLNPQPRVRISAPRNVETVVTDDAASRALRVHFLAYLVPPGATGPQRPLVLPDTMEDTPLFRARVHLREPVKSSHAFGPATQVEQEADGASLLIEDVHEVLTLRY